MVRISPMTSMMVAAVLASSFVLAACGGGGASRTQGVSGTQITAVMTEFAFTPSTWTVPAGSEVTLVLTNNGSLNHQWALLKAGIDVSGALGSGSGSHVYWKGDVGPGETKTFTFTAPSEPGDYTVVCGLPGHTEAGMTGTLTVTQ